MIYLEETLNLQPATPDTLDNFIDFAQNDLIPAYHELSTRLVAAWYSNVEIFCQVTQILEFEDLNAFGNYRSSMMTETKWQQQGSELESFAPVRRYRLLEPLVPRFSSILHKAMSDSQDTPLGSYNLAILNVAATKMNDMISGLSAIAESEALPIIMSWRPVAGNPNEVIDLWKGSLQQSGYQKKESYNSIGLTDEWWQNLRIMAPEERLISVYTLPHSPLM
ncbi:MAG: hypothetical protein QGD92_09935 [Gammaproteobacteria bacterium]|nr:hypothetical protein [Gammaproteobacteria bacterium]